ncbi:MULTISPECIES: hypothetical protein [Prochlorococcus]|uniref:hypothetical protein n=1 Tax=Prochlorococcus TaxID=1218 RepID=UPI000533A1C4|nr:MULTISPECIES: hypothetical protein [Prochlorococcus]KGG13707.1 putative Viral (Superfamily 1) RNA helicase [Prochlorococcus sp. MIT 0601]
MDSSRKRNNRRKRSSDPLERRVDQWFETGRQFVDGVSGNRPGNRRSANMRATRSGLNNVGRWVGDKIDWFFEEDDDWMESAELGGRPENLLSGPKKPLKAISLRIPKAIAPSVDTDEEIDSQAKEWPDESSFRLNRWKRSQVLDQSIQRNSSTAKRNGGLPNRRIPKSSRRKIN